MEVAVTTTEWMDSSIDDFEASNELNETSTEVPHIMFPFRNDFVQDDTIEQKRIACNYRSVKDKNSEQDNLISNLLNV